MRQNKLLDNLSNEQLLELFKAAPDENSNLETHGNNVVEFLKKYGLQRGTYLINRRSFYLFYKSVTKRPVRTHEFNEVVGCFLPVSQRNWKINKNPANFIPKTIENDRQTISVKSVHRKFFTQFIREYSITPGEFYVLERSFYCLFCEWYAEVCGKLPVHYLGFKTLCSELYKVKETPDGLYFGISDNTRNVFTDQYIQSSKDRMIPTKKGFSYEKENSTK